jgi:hypothetical protein
VAPQGGHYGHNQIPGNIHVDPGPMPDLFASVPAPAKPAVKYVTFPGAAFFVTGRRSVHIAAMHKRLVAEGCNHYQSSANSDTWGSGDKASYAAWQKKLGYTGSGADGIPGKTSWDKLHVPA